MSEDQLILTADPSFLDLALEELQNVAPPTAQQTLDDGVILVTLDGSFWEAAEQWRLAPPIFIRHICPVQSTVHLQQKHETDLAMIRQQVEQDLIDLVDPALPLSVQSRILTALPYKPFDINRALADFLQESTGVPIDVRAPHQVLSIVCAETTATTDGAQQPTAYIGLSPTAYNLSDWAGGTRRFAREPDQVSRAEFKLLEALEIFMIELPPRGVALDLGASPGGWTRVLRQREQYVTAIDPGDLDPRIAGDRDVRHKRMTAEQYLTDEPDRFDLIVNDMRMDARDSARLMVSYANHLYRHGIALMTLKLPEHNRPAIIDHAFAILAERYEIVGAKQLFHNRSEITLFLKLLP
ncbi:MAG: SAM-dependent methyltransferase [Caldilineaceae bacterium]